MLDNFSLDSIYGIYTQVAYKIIFRQLNKLKQNEYAGPGMGSVCLTNNNGAI